MLNLEVVEDSAYAARITITGDEQGAYARIVCPWRSTKTGRTLDEEAGKALGQRLVNAANRAPVLTEALQGVAILLRTELKDYAGEPWAQRVLAALE